MLVRLHQGMRQVSVLRGKAAVKYRLDTAAFNQRPDIFQQGLRNGGLECQRANPQRRTGHRQATAQDQTGVDFALDTTLHGNDDQASVLAQTLNFLGHIAARHHVQNNIDTLAARQPLDLILKIMRLVIDRMIRPQGQAGRTLFVTARRHQNPRAHGFCHLNGRHANATGATLDQQAFTALQMAPVKDVAPNREKCLRQ